MIFTEYKIDDLCLYITSGGTPKATNLQYYDNGTIPWMKTGEIHKGYIYNTETHITQEALKNSSAKLIPANSIIIAMYGDGGTAGNVAINKIPLSTNQACCNLVVNSKICNYQYLYFFLKGSYNDLVALKSGGSQQNLNGKTIKEFKILLPALPIQNIIASILSAYDELIENNKQRIKLLEEMAEEIYKEWFVRLRFPGYENIKQVDGLPECWIKKPIDEFLSFSMSKAKLKKFNDTKTYIATADVTDINITGQGEVIDWENKPSRAQLVPELNSVFFARMSNTYKVLVFSKTNKELIDELALTSGFLGLKALNEETLPYLFWLIKSDTFHNYKDVFANGATQVSLTNEGFHNIKLVEPSLSVIEKFGKSTSAFLSEIITLNKKNQVLQETRDLLLPRLISGKLSIEHLGEEELTMVAEPRENY
ncbi:restriction endonuclease subunit S [Flavobacterium psychrophilum]|uniref:restriction endonuclease subunit S n=1 Tax=Flavobacterium psychrophilum TaxID=96345 RepID=UPI0004F79733|nr:restriction endonuclease subunit S [Flavobacterium psychrophilum]AIN74080.1 type I restriction-modification system restriction subunit [Flavobacterium psychrophilum FPG3]EKT2070396.1 restriction endonuclease subunit S [Flavobacterium psychrophilum]EKT2072756.1 restriction endonuclease subunit S [Flavobacterium psychrophilum]EKT4492209.1 restriction endonuclease subunit S [Flavobacterium psychrophilum]MBF2045011.1 restriction endonuclease subunit S [Flavobacterium psychrophilum]